MFNESRRGERWQRMCSSRAAQDTLHTIRVCCCQSCSGNMQHAATTTTTTATAIQSAASRTAVLASTPALGTFLIIDNCPGHRFGILSYVCWPLVPVASVPLPRLPTGPVPVVASNALKCFFVKTSYTLQFALNPTWLWPGIGPLGRLQTGRQASRLAGSCSRPVPGLQLGSLVSTFLPSSFALPLAMSLFLCLCANPLAVAWQLKGIFMAKTYLFYTHIYSYTHTQPHILAHTWALPACLTPAHLARLIFDFWFVVCCYATHGARRGGASGGESRQSRVIGMLVKRCIMWSGLRHVAGGRWQTACRLCVYSSTHINYYWF